MILICNRVRNSVTLPACSRSGGVVPSKEEEVHNLILDIHI